jgi:hypothetical protein
MTADAAKVRGDLETLGLGSVEVIQPTDAGLDDEG